MKIYKVTDCDWWIASSAEEARASIIESYGNDDCVYPLDEIFELDGESMDRLKFYDEDHGVRRTFREELNRRIENGIKGPEMFASTEY